MPVLVLAISEYFDKLFEDGGLTAAATLSKLCGVVVMAINLAVVLIVAILGSKHCWAQGAGEVVDMIFPVERRDVGPAKSSAAFVAQQSQPAKVICLAEWVLPFSIIVVGGEELGGNDLTAVLIKKKVVNTRRESHNTAVPALGGGRRTTYAALEAVQVKGPVQCTHKLACQGLAALLAYAHLAAGRPRTPRPGSVPLSAASRLGVRISSAKGRRRWRSPQLVGVAPILA
jgi:hypothetical protein